MTVSVRFVLLGAALAMAAACDRVPLLAPTSAAIVMSAPTRILPLGGSTEVTAAVLEQAGTPVQNGTAVRFTTTLGTVSPSEVLTRNGLAVTTFTAGNTSGIAEIRATSGGAGSGTTSTGTGGTATSSGANVLQMTIGSAAVNTVTLRANPGSVPSSGGTVELIASVIAENARALDGVPVTFNTDQGTLNPAVVTTDSSGEARTLLTASQKASVTASAGTKTSSAVTVDIRTGPGVTVTCAPASGTGNCSSAQAGASGNTVTVVFTVSKSTGSSNLRTSSIDFGDSTSQSLGNLTGNASIPHTYTGPSGSTPRSYTATVSAVDINGESTSATTIVSVTQAPALAPLSVALTAGTPETATSIGQRWTFTATPAGGGEGATAAPISSYTWDFGDGTESVTTFGATISVTTHIYNTSTAGARYVVTVTARTTDGRTATGRLEIIAGKL